MPEIIQQSRIIRRAIEVTGIVQGVGFRPYVYRLATERSLTGRICNTSAGVLIEIEGPRDEVENFLQRLPRDVPPLARVTGMTIRELPCDHDSSFQIISSEAGAGRRALISPDVAICDDCLRELFDPADRRHLYPFINCTNCGPRFTIVRDIPYDRARTSMGVFRMCAACQAEYDDPASRRFHAQPNACWDCGPQVELRDASGRRVATGNPIAEAAQQLQAGAIVAVKGLGGFHLACDATNAAAVETLRVRKHRVEKPFAVMARSLAAAEEICAFDVDSRALLLRRERPIVLARRKQPSAIAAAVAPFNRDLGIILPYTPLHHLLFAAGTFSALVMTSGNLSEEPIAIDNREALERLRDLADFFLLHNREILLRADDSVVRASRGHVRQLRRSRGYVPVPVFLHKKVPEILAVGGELKNTICLTKGDRAFLSQHIGDLENLESFRFFEEVVAHLERILEIEPRILAHDLHPDYFSTRWALAQTGARRVGVQHHHAHIAACMAENHLEGRVIGFALDGTGYGADGRVWGGEVLLADYRNFERAAHLAYVPMPGGAEAIRQPWRMAVSFLFRHFGRDFLRFPLPLLRRHTERDVETLLRMMEKEINSLLTSSCGRLFDAVSALLGIREVINYEGQAAIELEMAMDDSADSSAYPCALRERSGAWEIDTLPLFEAILRDLQSGISPGPISRRFHNGLARIFVQVALLLRQRAPLSRVCLSGGTFQNVYFVELLESQLRASGFEVFTHSELPAGDGGLSLGQALVAAHQECH